MNFNDPLDEFIIMGSEECYTLPLWSEELEGGGYKTGPVLNAAGMGSKREAFSVTGDRGSAPYPQPKSRVFDTRKFLNNPHKPVEYHAPNPRSKDYVFNNKHGKLSVPRGISLTSGTAITADSDYLVGNYRDGAPVSSYWAGVPSAFSSGAVGLGFESVGNQYGGSMLHRENNTFNGFTKNTTARCVDHVGAVRGVYMGPPEPNINGIDIEGVPPPPGLSIPKIFHAPNKTMDDYFTNIAYIKDNPQIVEFYGSNVFELMEDGMYGGTRPSSITATSKRNIVGEHFDERIVDLRFGNGTPYQYALANGPGSTPRGVYLDMITVKAMRPVLDYIFYLETGGAVLPDQTDEFYFVTEEQYFSTGPLDRDLVHYCSKRYNTGMIDVFKFLNYAFQYFFKRDPMVTADFRTYSKLIDKFVENHYSTKN